VDQWQELEAKYFMRTFSRVPLTLVRGQGSYVWDVDGNKYLDFVCGWAVDSLGHCHPAVVKAVQEQVGTLIQASNQYYTVPQVQLAELLVKNSALDRVFFCNSGAEANEGAAKLARRYGERYLKGAYKIVTTLGSFHGRTLMMVAATGQQHHQEAYAPLPNGFVNVAFNDIDAIRGATTESTCAVMLEPIQGEGGVNVPDAGYLKAVRQWCDEKGILLILDEIQTGIGRCGSLFAYEQFGVVPDIITLAKGIASGLPLGAFLATERVSVFQPGDHGSTFGGNPVMCAAAYATVNYILENGVVAHAAEMGERLTQGLMALRAKYPAVIDVRGRGLLLAVEFDREIGQAVLDGCLSAGLLVNRVKPNAVRLMPPLTVSPEEVDACLEILDRVLAETAL
jgi:acetylornithine/N-succinyldiaminopimelate aminotransferase